MLLRQPGIFEALYAYWRRMQVRDYGKSFQAYAALSSARPFSIAILLKVRSQVTSVAAVLRRPSAIRALTSGRLPRFRKVPYRLVEQSS